jgi:uncharacterized protein YggE
MATIKPRLNLSLSKDTREALAKLARRDNVPQATKAARLLETALELEEDQVWEVMAKKRNTKGTHYIAHDKAWE